MTPTLTAFESDLSTVNQEIELLIQEAVEAAAVAGSALTPQAADLQPYFWPENAGRDTSHIFTMAAVLGGRKEVERPGPSNPWLMSKGDGNIDLKCEENYWL